MQLKVGDYVKPKEEQRKYLHESDRARFLFSKPKHRIIRVTNNFNQVILDGYRFEISASRLEKVSKCLISWGKK